MPWNEPGSGKSPNSNREGGPDIEDILKNIRDNFGGGGGNKKSSAPGGLPIISLVLVGVVLFWLFKSFYTVEEGYESLEFRFGKYTSNEPPGLRFIVWPIESNILVNTQTIRTVEVGYRDSGPQLKEALMLTNDENIVDVTMAVQYTIKNVEDLIFNVGNVRYPGVLDDVVRGATESVLREVVGGTKMDDLLTEGRNVVDANTEELLQTVLDRYQTGIQIESVEIQDAKPPREVRDAFDDVVKADQDKVTLVNQAEAYANDLLPRARGRAARIMQEAEAYLATVVADAEGQAQRFNQVQQEYSQAPEITRKRMYLETMENVLSNTNKVLVDQSNNNSLMYLPIDKILEAGRSRSSASSLNSPSSISSETLIEKLPETNRTRTTTGTREGR